MSKWTDVTSGDKRFPGLFTEYSDFTISATQSHGEGYQILRVKDKILCTLFYDRDVASPNTSFLSTLSTLKEIALKHSLWVESSKAKEAYGNWIDSLDKPVVKYEAIFTAGWDAGIQSIETNPIEARDDYPNYYNDLFAELYNTFGEEVTPKMSKDIMDAYLMGKDLPHPLLRSLAFTYLNKLKETDSVFAWFVKETTDVL